jgi:large subunit ribosomal protein L23
MEPRTVVKQFLATEKSTIAKETEGKYAFAVDARANKYQIKEAVEKLFKVEVSSVSGHARKAQAPWSQRGQDADLEEGDSQTQRR